MYIVCVGKWQGINLVIFYFYFAGGCCLFRSEMGSVLETKRSIFLGIQRGSYLLYFIAILHWSIGHPSSASIDGGFWLELVVRQKASFRIPPKQCASRWLWGVLVIFFLAGSILIRCGKFHFDFFVECVLSNEDLDLVKFIQKYGMF
jgi:hypothetical protein